MKEIFLPALGTAMEEGTVVEWLKVPGDLVEVGEGVALIETDKTTIELESPVAGRIHQILVPEGATVPVGQTIALVADPAG